VEIPATRETGRKVDEFVGEEIGEFILGSLTDEYDLDVFHQIQANAGN
jgi:hypothetical protein